MDQSNTPPRADHLSHSDQAKNGIASPNSATSDPAPSAPSAPPEPLSAGNWISQNGPWLGIIGVLFAVCYMQFGPERVLAGIVALIGLGFVIFIHELGHFLAAKWCDVHVVTFSIGFGPALPGCSFTRGETTYKLALLPLGGYVNMVGEGPEADEDEDYPRSFKNKSVGARMLIISAGVIMNVIFGALCFIAVYRYFGVPQEPAIFSRIEPGGPAWEAGVHAGWKVTKLNNQDDPSFLDMRRAVNLSSAGKPLEFTFVDREGKTHERKIEPFRDQNGLVPMIGVVPGRKLQLLSDKYKKEIDSPLKPNSPAAYARVLDLKDGDVLLQASDPVESSKLTPLPTGQAGWIELCKRFQKAADKTLQVEVNRGGEKKVIDVPPVGFEFGDRIVGTTDPNTSDHPFKVSELTLDPEQEGEQDLRDPFVFRTRMVLLAGKPIVIQVRRVNATASSPPLNLLIGPAYHVTLGARMKMGKIAAIRPSSPAENAGLKTGTTDGDVITGVRLQYDNEPEIILDEAAMDPVRLPYELEQRIRSGRRDVSKWRVILKVRGTINHDAQNERSLAPMKWDDSYSILDETPISPQAPLSIPQLGIAYWIESTVVKVEPNSPADKAGLKPGDIVQEYRFRVPGRKKAADTWSPWVKIASVRGKEKEVFDQWAQVFEGFQTEELELPLIRLRIKRVADASEPVQLELPETEDKNAGIELVNDPTWPMPNRGVILDQNLRILQTDSLVHAIRMGFDETLSMIKLNYRSMSGLVSGRISAKTMGGPIEIGYQAISAAGDNLWRFAQLLGIISIGLAVVNFLPIPVLDGGHMVFLIYEKLRGKPPSEGVRIAATYLGLAFILGLMLFVFGLDFMRRILPGIKSLFGG